MQFTEKTVELIVALSLINDGLIFRPGNILRTKNYGNSIHVEATLDQEIPKHFAITDVRRFIAALNMFGEPDIEITDHHVIMTAGSEQFKYTCADERVIHAPPDKPVNLPDPNDTFDLPKETFQRIVKAVGMLGESAEHPEIQFVTQDSELVAQVTDTRNTSCPVFRSVIGDTNEEIDLVFSADKLKVVHPSNYKLSVFPKMIKLESPSIWYAILPDIKRSM